MAEPIQQHLGLVAGDASLARRVQNLVDSTEQASASYQLVHCETAAALQTHLDAQPMDLVLLEAAHPEAVNIVELLDERIPVVLVAEQGDAALVQQVEAFGVQDYLALQPPDPFRLLFILRTGQNQRHLAQRWATQMQDARDEFQHLVRAARHDLLQPIRTSSLFLELLQDEWGERLNADANRWVTSVRSSLQRMQQLIDALQTYVRIDAAPLQRESVDLDAVLKNVLGQLGEQVEATSATVTHDALPTVKGNASQLETVLYHLTRNALTFHGEAPPQVHLTGGNAEGVWEITVTDQGIGLDPEYSERIFGVFERLHAQATYPGIGMGLAVCKKIIERHGGRVWVEPVAGHGATFLFTLPE